MGLQKWSGAKRITFSGKKSQNFCWFFHTFFGKSARRCQLCRATAWQPSNFFWFRKKFLKVHNWNFQNHLKPHFCPRPPPIPLTCSEIFYGSDPWSGREGAACVLIVRQRGSKRNIDWGLQDIDAENWHVTTCHVMRIAEPISPVTWSDNLDFLLFARKSQLSDPTSGPY